MGVETAIALGVGGSLLGSYQQGQANNQNYNAQMAVLRQQQAQNNLIKQYVGQNMQQGANPFANVMMQMMGLPGLQTVVGNNVNVPGQAAIGTPPAGQAGAGTGASGEFVSDMNYVMGGGSGTGGQREPTTPEQGAGGGGSQPGAGSGQGDTPGNSGGGQGQTPPGYVPGLPGITLPGTGQVTIPGQVNPLQRPDQINWFGYDAAQMGMPEAINPNGYAAVQANTPDVDLTAFSGGNSAFNSGQDALSQMLRANGTLGNVAAGGTQYNNTPLFQALNAQDALGLQDQMAQLQGSFGSFGSRLGTAAMRQQGNLRNQFLTQQSARNQQIGAQSFESAQARAMQALGMQAQAAQGLGGMGMNQMQMLAGLAQGNQQVGANVNLANAAAQNAAQQFFGQQGLQAALANQQAGLQVSGTNAAALNAASQFNMNNQMGAQAQNAQAQQAWNNMMMQGVGQANAMQQAQQGQNISLLSLLAGLPIGQAPIAQPGQWGQAMGDIGSLMMMNNYMNRKAA